jgi:serine/threonine protein kinase
VFKDRSERYKTTADRDNTGGSAAPTLLSLAVVDKPVPPILALTLIRQVAEALAEASHSGLIHKNLRPETILFDMNDLPVVLNFDSIPLSEQDEAEEMIYASPEQKEGKVLDSRSNIYTLGIILYELLHGVRPGEMPFPEQNLAPAEDGESGISSLTLRVVDTCRKEQAWVRYQNYRELLVALDGALAAESASADSPTVPTVAGSGAEGQEKAGKRRAWALSLNNRWLPILATILFLALLGVAMVSTWDRPDSSAVIPIFEQLPLLMGGENSPARQTAVSEEATATIRALQIRLPSRTPTPLPTVEATGVTEEPPIAAGVPTETPTPHSPTPTPTPTATSTSPPPPPPSPTETPTETAVPTLPPTPTLTNTPPPPPPPGPTSTPQPSPTNAPTSVPTNTPEPTEPPPTATPLPPTPTPPTLPTSTPPPATPPTP